MKTYFRGLISVVCPEHVIIVAYCLYGIQMYVHVLCFDNYVRLWLVLSILICFQTAVFYRVTPKHKVIIVKVSALEWSTYVFSSHQRDQIVL